MIIATAYLPVLTLTGVEGKMFTPMALTVLMAPAGAAILSMTFVPAAVALFVSGRVPEHENIFMRAPHRVYVPLLSACIRDRGTVALIAVVLVVGSALPRRGWEESSFRHSTKTTSCTRCAVSQAPA
jgi:cobalt-zinc-cadmium resistance protein CzcA